MTSSVVTVGGGIGKCGRCNVGRLYVCKDGPVFSYATLKEIPEAFA